MQFSPEQLQGKFVTFEGIEGVGKSTQVQLAATLLRAKSYPVLESREPGGTELGERLRAILLDPMLKSMHSDTELLLMFAARNEHLQRVIIPALRSGHWVLCDRFTDATFAYQGGGRKISVDRIAQMEAFVQGELQPDLTLLFDAPVELALMRAKSRSEADRFEQETLAFFQAVREAYLQRASLMRARFRIIDASRSQSEIAAEVASLLSSLV